MGRSLVRAAEAVRVEARAAVESMEATETVVDQTGAGMAAATVVTTEKAKVEAMQAAAASAAPLEEAGVTVAVKAVAAEAKARVAKVLVVQDGVVRPAAAAIQAAFRPVCQHSDTTNHACSGACDYACGFGYERLRECSSSS